MRNYVVVVTRITRGKTQQEALEIATRERGNGLRTEILTEQQANLRFGKMQDLTEMSEWEEFQKARERKKHKKAVKATTKQIEV